MEESIASKLDDKERITPIKWTGSTIGCHYRSATYSLLWRTGVSNLALVHYTKLDIFTAVIMAGSGGHSQCPVSQIKAFMVVCLMTVVRLTTINLFQLNNN